MAKKNDPDKKTKNSERKAKSEKKTKPERKDSYNFDNKTMTTYENGQEKNIPLNNKQIAELLYGKKLIIRGKNANQKELLKQIGLKEITIAVGPAGTGKSFCGIAKALELLACPDNNYQKIYIVTPTIEIDDSIGYLKGSLEDKMMPYLFSTYYLIDKIIGVANRKKLQELNIVEPLCIGYIRGMSVDNAILIGEEMQNTTSLQFKSLITRIGFSSCFILNGDLEQIDRKGEKSNGLQDALDKFKDMSEIGIVQFQKEDIVRNPIISKILSKY